MPYVLCKDGKYWTKYGSHLFTTDNLQKARLFTMIGHAKTCKGCYEHNFKPIEVKIVICKHSKLQ